MHRTDETSLVYVNNIDNDKNNHARQATLITYKSSVQLKHKLQMKVLIYTA